VRLVREGDHRSFRTKIRPPGLLQRLLRAAADGRSLTPRQLAREQSRYIVLIGQNPLNAEGAFY